MRTAIVMLLLGIALIGWGTRASGQAPPVLAVRLLTLIPTALQELDELRLNTGTKAVFRDGTLSAVYDKKVPTEGSTYLNFHLDVASEAGPFMLRVREIRLVEDAPVTVATSRAEGMGGKAGSAPASAASYTPFDWFIDDGLTELRGDSLIVNNKALVQFTIEVPQAGRDDLTLFVQSQRIGTVREVRARIAKDRGLE